MLQASWCPKFVRELALGWARKITGGSGQRPQWQPPREPPYRGPIDNPDGGPMNIGDRGFDLIRAFEGFRADPYLDGLACPPSATAAPTTRTASACA